MKKRIRRTAGDILTLLLALLVITPVLYGVCGAFKSASEFAAQPPTFLPRSFANLENFTAVITGIPIGRYFLNSLIVALLITAVRLTCAVLAAFAFVYYEFRGRRFLFIFVLATMMLPSDTLLVTNYQTVSRLGLLNTYLGMSVVSFVGASQMFMLRQTFRSTPKAFREAAWMDGCGDMRYLVRILLPMSTPVLVTLFVQSFSAAWNTYLWPLMSTTHDDMRTIQVGISMLTTLEGTNYEVVLAGVTLSLLPALFVFLFLRRAITKAMTGGALVG